MSEGERRDDLHKIAGAEFVRRLRAKVVQGDCPIAFFLGAGCSVSSGIPASRDLVRDRWLPRLRHFLAGPRGQDVEEWAIEHVPGYDPEKPASSYGPVMEMLFHEDLWRQREIEDLCQGRMPTFGYGVLATLMAERPEAFSVVLTTNFDDLVEDSLYLFTGRRPLVIHHESLAGYIRSHRTRPMVVKLHGDHQLSPKNTVKEVGRILENVEEGVNGLLLERGLVFLGYGGADKGIVSMLRKLPESALPHGIYWIAKDWPETDLGSWLANRRNVTWVKSADFDELMLLIRHEFDLPHPKRDRIMAVFDGYETTFADLSQKVFGLSPKEPGDVALREAAESAAEGLPKWLSIEIHAREFKESDPARADKIYRAGLETSQGSRELLGNYANFLTEVLGDHDGAEERYKQSLEADPNSANNLGNYATFLRRIRGDYDGADEQYKLALEADSNHANNLGNYASFLTTERDDHEGAEEYYKRALDADPNHAHNLGNYASFLTDVRGDHDGAEEHFRRALQADPNDIGALGNFATFLRNVRGDYDGAEEHYKRALEADSNHANNLGNYASFLTDIRGDHDGAEKHYKRALEVDPNHADHVGTYANFLRNVRGDYDGAGEHYKRALEADSNHANNLGNYASFLTTVLGDRDGAEVHFKRSLEADPNHANNLGNYAGLLLGGGRLNEGMESLARAMSAPDFQKVSGLQAECWFYLYANGPAERRDEALMELKRVLADGDRSPGWDLSANLAWALENAHPAGDWLPILAEVIADEAEIRSLDGWPEWAAA